MNSDEGDRHGDGRGVISGEHRIQWRCLAGLPMRDQTVTGAQGLAVVKIPQNPRQPNGLQNFQADFQNSQSKNPREILVKSSKNPAAEQGLKDLSASGINKKYVIKEDISSDKTPYACDFLQRLASRPINPLQRYALCAALISTWADLICGHFSSLPGILWVLCFLSRVSFVEI